MALDTETAFTKKISAVLGSEDLVVVLDESDGCGAKFNVLVVSDSFTGKMPLERHQWFNEAFAAEIAAAHAVSMTLWTHKQFAKRQERGKVPPAFVERLGEDISVRTS